MGYRRITTTPAVSSTRSSEMQICYLCLVIALSQNAQITSIYMGKACSWVDKTACEMHLTLFVAVSEETGITYLCSPTAIRVHTPKCGSGAPVTIPLIPYLHR
jgi:hypothetical protein